jgi:hypothetical protein
MANEKETEEMGSEMSGIIIQEDDFILEPIKDSVFYDLQMKKIVKPRGGTPREEWYDAAYGVTLKHALQLVARQRIAKKFNRYIVLQTYITSLENCLAQLSRYDGVGSD